jgi:error-prone DNA polymerase
MYIELHTASAFSFLDGASLPERLVERAVELGYPALALLDRDGVYGAPRFHVAAKKAGVRALIGAELTIRTGAGAVRASPTVSGRSPRASPAAWSPHPPRLWRLPVLVASREGYRNLCRLVTRMKLEAPKGEGALALEDLDGQTAGLVALAGRAALDAEHYGVGGLLDRLVGLFGRGGVYVELQRHLLRDQEADNQALQALAAAFRVPVIATNGVRFASPDERPLFDALTCLRLKTTLAQAGRRLAWNAERHLKPPDAMATLFADLPHAVAATRDLAARLDYTMADLGYRFPDYPVPAGETQASFLRHITEVGARHRYRPYHDAARAQVARELALIEKLDLAGYFLIVWDIVNFCRQHGILAQGRGSAANSAVCYSLGITAVDPVGMELLFERFLSEERGEWPDIDLDLPSGDRRERVIQYVYERYGALGAAMTANVITYRTRSAAREMGKVLDMAPDVVDRLTKAMTPFEWQDPQETLARHLAEVGLDAGNARVGLFADLWRRIQDLPRHLGQHSGGMVMCQGRLDDIVPLEPASMPGRVVIQWDKEDCADLGIVKVDLLGLGMMAVLQDALTVINAGSGAWGLGTGRREGLQTPGSGQDRLQAPGFGLQAAHQEPRTTNGPRTKNEEPGTDEGSNQGSTVSAPPVPRPQAPGTAPSTKHQAPGTEQDSSVSAPPVPRPQAPGPGMYLDLARLPPDDPVVYRMLQEADTIGVFQVESRAQMATLPRLKPRTFYDLVVEVALIRPGPIVGQMVHPFIARRNGRAPVEYPHPSLEPILKRTLGVPLFQEQLLRMAMVAAGFTGGEAEELRRAMGFKRSEARMRQIETKLRDGMARTGITGEAAEAIVRSITSFALYGFPESHAASFALLVYASAYLKAHFPAAFYAALLDNQPMGFYHPATIVKDAQRHGVGFRPIDVQVSNWLCTIEPDGAIRLGLSYVSGLREEVGRAIERQGIGNRGSGTGTGTREQGSGIWDLGSGAVGSGFSRIGGDSKERGRASGSGLRDASGAAAVHQEPRTSNGPRTRNEEPGTDESSFAGAAPGPRPQAPGPTIRCPKCGADDPSMLEIDREDDGRAARGFCNVCAHEWGEGRGLGTGAWGLGEEGLQASGPGLRATPGTAAAHQEPGTGQCSSVGASTGLDGHSALEAGEQEIRAGARSPEPAARRRFRSIEHLIAVTGIRRDELATLAEIGALNAFGYDRRGALWQIERAVRPAGELFTEERGLEGRGLGTGAWGLGEEGLQASGSGRQAVHQAPAFAPGASAGEPGTAPGTRHQAPGTSNEPRTPPPPGPRPQAPGPGIVRSPLRPMSLVERVVADYEGTGLTIGPHPMALRRPELALRGILRATDLPRGRAGRRVRVAGAVITRQRPGTAKGMVFLTLEDETGVSNIIVRPDVFAEQRQVIVQAPYVIVEGVLQQQDGVTAVRAERVERLTDRREEPPIASHDFY